MGVPKRTWTWPVAVSATLALSAAPLATAALAAADATGAATSLSASPTVVAAPTAKRDADLPTNQRQPKVPNPPDLGDAPWTTDAAKDMKGYRLSTYTGKYYDKRLEQYRLCVVQRESGGNYDLNSYYQGAYQFGPFWADPIISRLKPEISAVYGNAGVAQLSKLAGTRISSWPRFWQDAAFWTIFNNGAGYANWSGGNWYCDHRPNRESGWPSANHWNYTPLERSKGGGSSSGSTDAGAPTNTARAATGTPANSKRIARTYIAKKYGWDRAEFTALKNMWWRESNWRYDVVNNHPNGPWYGLAQVTGGFINDQGYTVKKYMASPRVQVKVGTAYIKQRYGSPTTAWSFWQSNGWY